MPATTIYRFDALDWVITFYFVSHIPITYLLDLQALLPDFMYPFGLRGIREWYIDTWHDPLFVPPVKTWFLAVLLCEAVLQLPFFFFAVYAWLNRREWIRLPALVYGVHVATTLVPILPTLLQEGGANAVFLTSVYSPYLIVPLLIAWRCFSRDVLFPAQSKRNLKD